MMMSGEPILGNGIIPRLAFITIIIIAFYILLRIGLVILAYFYGENKSPHLIDGMVKSNNYRLIKQNPTLPGSKPVYRSDNENTGGEYTWSVWLYMDQAQSLIKDGTDPVPYHIFSKGTKQLATVDNNRYPVTNGPGLYLVPQEQPNSNEISHDLYILVDTYGNGDDDISGRGDEQNSITITDVPLKKWVNIIIRAQHKTIDVFINGVLSRRKIYSNVIKQNYGDVHVALELGNTTTTKGIDNGYISNLWYYDRAIGTVEILSIVNKGPDTKYLGEENISSVPSYLSRGWYTTSLTS
tara:strand:- start:26589 stop:27479 length:891 start_codon:yes stop_codon:yes gene_type:complete